jgi:hypothetical protein
VLWGTAVASRDASRRVITLNFFTTKAHPMGEGLETFELITLGSNGIDRARCMQHWKDGALEKICSVFGERRVSEDAKLGPFGESLERAQPALRRAPAAADADATHLLVRSPRTGMAVA